MLSLLSERARPQAAGADGLAALKGKIVYIPPMAYGSARTFAAGLRALGLDCRITPPSDERTLELGGRHTSGDECYPAKVTIGDFLKVLEAPGADPARTVIFHPTAEGPCRFGQYSTYLREVLDANGYHRTGILSPSSKDSYAGLGQTFVRTSWRMLVCADILQKLMLKSRPHEPARGTVEAVYQLCLDDVCDTVETAPLDAPVQLKALSQALERSLYRFRKIPLRRDAGTVRIGVVGEIFCRLNTFSNNDVVRRIERCGAEVWLSDITEWVWYTAADRRVRMKLAGRQYSLEALGAWVRGHVQHRDEQALLAPFREEFAGWEEPDVETVLDLARPYLPPEGALGEMVLNIGKSIYLAGKGVDGIIDISPFTCMNGIVSEAIYPRLSRDLGGIPIRNLYFDGTQSDLERDLGVYMELARSYRKKRLAA
jgi:predicted nucleotide-binding protein (sugar kinase/HSP70/actin superfamily)